MDDDLLDSALACPINNAVFEDPVQADDGHTYSKNAIESWFADCKERGAPLSSPLTREIMSESLSRSHTMEKAIREYKEKFDKGERQAKRQCLGGFERQQELSHLKDLSQLGAMFAQLDGLRGLLEKTLDWEPPKFVVVGVESSGKSSVLERLMMTPLLPRDEVLNLYGLTVFGVMCSFLYLMSFITGDVHPSTHPCSSSQRPGFATAVPPALPKPALLGIVIFSCQDFLI